MEKSIFVEALATLSNCAFFNISVANIQKEWHDDQNTIFEIARKSEFGAIIFVAEVDSLCKDQSNPEIDSLSNAILSQLLVEMGGLERNNANVIILGATNLPMQMDRAMLPHFEKRVHIHLPDAGAQEDIVKSHF